VFENLPQAVEKRFPKIVPAFFRVDPDGIESDDTREAVFGFLAQKPSSPGEVELSGGGFGAVAWLSRGKVVAYERYAGKAGLEGLLRKTEGTIEDPALRC